TLSLFDVETGEQFWNTEPGCTRWRYYDEWVAFDNKAPDYSHMVLNLEEDQETGVGKNDSNGIGQKIMVN
ncbi:hypothetical protein J4Q44_G00270850, partial [Coregonus suidteri]